MVEPPGPLKTLSEDQRAQVHTCLTIIRSALEDGSTIARWAKRSREHGLADRSARSDKGASRRLPAEAVMLIAWN